MREKRGGIAELCKRVPSDAQTDASDERGDRDRYTDTSQHGCPKELDVDVTSGCCGVFENLRSARAALGRVHRLQGQCRFGHGVDLRT